MNYVRRLPPPKLLLAFEAAARTSNFTEAARLLNVHQPAVSRQIRSLEQFLGVDLFFRNGPTVTLTAAGERYRDTVVDAFQRLVAAGDYLPRPTRDRIISISANYGLAAYWLMPRLAKFQAENSGVTINVITTEHQTRLRPDGIDIAIRFGHGAWDDGEATLLFAETVFPVCSPDYLRTHVPLQSTADLSHHTLIDVQARGALWCDWRRWLATYGLAANCEKLGFNNFTLSLQAAIDGRGVALGWAHVVDSHLQERLLVRPLQESVSTRLGYYAVVSPDVAGSLEVAALIGGIVADKV